jgi:hypothetical protein
MSSSSIIDNTPKFDVSLLTPLRGFLSTQELSTLTPSKFIEICQHCSQQIRCSKLGCSHIVCVDCLDCLVDTNIYKCPVCHEDIKDVQYLL